MATTQKATPRAPAQPKDAVAFLKADHKKVSGLFEQFESSRSSAQKKRLVEQICMELTVHTLKTRLDMVALRDQMSARKQQLLTQGAT